MLVVAMNHSRICFRTHQDVAIGQHERRSADKFPGQLGCLAGPVLHQLAPVTDIGLPFGAARKMVFNYLRAKACDDKDIANPRADEPFDDMFENRFAMDRQHGFGQLIGQFSHPRAFAGCQNHSFHPVSLRGANSLAKPNFPHLNLWRSGK